MSPESLILSSLSHVDVITAHFSRNLTATDPDILSYYDDKLQEDVLTEYWGRAAKNIALRISQDMLEIWAKENRRGNKKETDVFKRRGVSSATFCCCICFALS